MANVKAIRELVHFAKTDKTNTNKILRLGLITIEQSVTIECKTGFELIGYERTIDTSAIRHILKKHGNQQKEMLRGQIAVTDEDFELIQCIAMPDNIISFSKNKLGNDCLLYKIKLDDTFFYAEEIRTGKKHLALNTLYKRK